MIATTPTIVTKAPVLMIPQSTNSTLDWFSESNRRLPDKFLTWLWFKIKELRSRRFCPLVPFTQVPFGSFYEATAKCPPQTSRKPFADGSLPSEAQPLCRERKANLNTATQQHTTTPINTHQHGPADAHARTHARARTHTHQKKTHARPLARLLCSPACSSTRTHGIAASRTSASAWSACCRPRCPGHLPSFTKSFPGFIRAGEILVVSAPPPPTKRTRKQKGNILINKLRRYPPRSLADCRGTLVEPWWNPGGTLAEPYLRGAPDNRNLSGLRPQSFQLLGN